ncbi:hypothetical protein EXIGLDRAFT_745670 [Exidia glandulosa HHB12029]|uniref:DUF6535 domain-containing protein n=1 Tax=Exidia glandulosa HHB12029 TaxID=1314781 RepID=A0A165N9N1_EXIGL|nr:hypothetical protein EXIGLDRAFT_745670 [Exidia glandulosa HHB12029]
MDYAGGFTEDSTAAVENVNAPPVAAPEEPLVTDFKKKYPPDPLGREMDDTARVWKVYRDEATAHDETMLDGWNKTLDVLLIFAGLFSAVATAFLIESYKLLEPDQSSAYMSTALYLLVTRDNPSTSSMLPPPPALGLAASTMSRAVNWLWFTSLLLALAVALLGILIKQWIVEYNARNAASAESPRHWAIRHQLFFQAMTGWPVADLVSVLPVMLHASLFLFFGGVALFVWDLDRGIGAWVAVLGLALGGFYVACSLIPLWIPECPTATPVVNLIRRSILWLRISMLRIGIVLYTRSYQVYDALCRHRFFRRAAGVGDPETGVPSPPRTPRDVYSVPQFDLAGYLDQPPPANDAQGRIAVVVGRWTEAITCLDAQSTARSILTPILDRRRCGLEGDALLWLNFAVSDSDSTAVALQAIGGVQPTTALATYLRRDPKLKSMTWRDASARFSMVSNPVERMRIVRSMLVFDIQRNDLTSISNWHFYHFLLNLGQYPDMLFMNSVRDVFLPLLVRSIREPPPGIMSPSLTSTVLLFLRYKGLDLTNLLISLLWCDFTSSALDWDFVIESLISAALRKIGVLRNASSQALVVLDLLAQLWEMETRERTASLIQRLMIHILAAPDRDPDGEFLDLYRSPYFLSYLASAAFATQIVPESALSRVDHALDYRSSSCPSDHISQIELLAQSVALSIRLRTTLHRPPPASINVYHDPLRTAMPERRLATGSTSLAVLLRQILILEPIHSQTVPLSLWDMIPDSDPNSHWDFVGGLVRYLSIAERYRYDVSDIVDTLLAQITLQNLHTYFQKRRHRKYGLFIPFRMAVAHIVQHCIELRPRWWLDILHSVIDDDSVDQVLKVAALRVDREVSRRGPCLACPGVPLGWDDDEYPSSCAFNPVPALPVDLGALPPILRPRTFLRYRNLTAIRIKGA